MVKKRITERISSFGSDVALLVYRAIKKLESTYGKLIPCELLMFAVEKKELNINKRELQAGLEVLKNENVIYEPREGYVMVV